MTTLREAAQRALDALDTAIYEWRQEMEFRSCIDVADQWAAAADALRAALAEPTVASDCADSHQPQGAPDERTCATCRHWKPVEVFCEIAMRKVSGGECHAGKFFEDCYSEPDTVVYPYLEGTDGVWWTGPEFGCVHWAVGTQETGVKT